MWELQFNIECTLGWHGGAVPIVIVIVWCSNRQRESRRAWSMCMRMWGRRHTTLSMLSSAAPPLPDKRRVCTLNSGVV